jgi:hypothetical protein
MLRLLYGPHAENMVIGKLKHLIEQERGTYHPTILISFQCGHMVRAEHGSVLEGGGPVSQNGNKRKKSHV